MGCEALNAFADTFSDPYSCSLTSGLESGTSVAGGGAAAGQLGNMQAVGRRAPLYAHSISPAGSHEG